MQNQIRAIRAIRAIDLKTVYLTVELKICKTKLKYICCRGIKWVWGFICVGFTVKIGLVGIGSMYISVDVTPMVKTIPKQ